MSTRKSKTTSSQGRWWLAGALLALGIVLFLVFGNSGRQSESFPSIGRGGEPAVASESGNSPAQPRAGPETSAPRRPTRSSLDRTAAKDESISSQFPQVERILRDDSLSERQAAEALCLIARNRELSVEERDEALANGLRLDFEAFAALPTDPSLPVTLAQRYFDELANHSDLPQQQIEGYLGLMGHGDEGIRTQATEQLAFVLGDEELAETPEALRRAARERLEALKSAPPEQNPAATEGSAEEAAAE